MSTSDLNRKIELQKVFTGLLLSAGCAVFGCIYEKFSHGVYSEYMIYAFMIPLLFCVIPNVFLLLLNKKPFPEIFGKMWNYGIATLTVGSILKGVLEIYGTTNRYLIIYPILAGVFAILSVVLWIAGIARKKRI